MTKRLFIILTLTLQLTNIFGQDLQIELKENVVKIEHLNKLDKLVYEKLKDFNLIMIGELHGSNEPANFLIGLTGLFANYGDTVQVGFEIPDGLMTAYNRLLTDSSVYQSDFFLNGFDDGRASIAWANAITQLTKNSRVQVFFYDIYKTESNGFLNRDSIMYLNIKRRLVEHPNWRIITLSGNVHIMRLKFRENPTAANYLCNDKDLNLTYKICTLNHIFLCGTVYNNTGNGLELRKVNNNPSIFSETFDFDNYLYLYKTANNYNGIFFTKNITASELIKK